MSAPGVRTDFQNEHLQKWSQLKKTARCSVSTRRRDPDRGGVITEAKGSAFEMFDADPGADQGIEHVFDRFERGKGAHLRRPGDERRNSGDMGIEA